MITMINKNLLYSLFILSFFWSNAQQKISPIKAPVVVFKNKLSVAVRDCWQYLDIEKDTIPGTSLHRAYQEIIKNKKGKTVIVAVIDTDIDIHHEDLKSAIWVNKKEIPNNGIDDDHNGYVDDVNGWNFLGNKNGESTYIANTGSIRILRDLKKKYLTYPNFKGNKSDSLLNIKGLNAYKKNTEEIDFLRKNALANITKYTEAEKVVKKHFNKSDYTYIQIDSLYKKNKKSADAELLDNLYYLRYYVRLGRNLHELKNDSIREEEKFTYSNNENFYDRKIIGDNEYDINDKYYGNNNVSKNAKITHHGTIVSGLIAANRANKIGIEGFNDAIQIMPIVAAPICGLEHDKDIALAIRYAVDNGAKIINMSFGYPISTHPEWIKEAFLYAEKHDVLLVAGSGNDSSDNDIVPFYAIDYDEVTGKEFCNNYIKVGSSTTDGDANFLPPYSNYGKKTVDIFAPGHFLKTTDANGGYSFQDGTSMAGPIVCGVAALVRSYYPKLTAAQVKQIILDSGVAYNLQVQVPGEKEGVLKPFSEMSKSGKVVNAYNALLMAKEVSRK
jgi:cell wall-associated protease